MRAPGYLAEAALLTGIAAASSSCRQQKAPTTVENDVAVIIGGASLSWQDIWREAENLGLCSTSDQVCILTAGRIAMSDELLRDRVIDARLEALEARGAGSPSLRRRSTSGYEKTKHASMT